MKKLLAFILATLMCIGCFALVGCGGVEGTYKFDSMEITILEETKTYTKDDIPEDYQQYVGDVNVTFEVKADGTIVSTAVVNGETMTAENNWVLNDAGDEMTIMQGDRELAKYKVEGGKLISEDEMVGFTMRIIFAK